MPHVEFRLDIRQRLYWLVVGGLWLPVAALRLAAGGALSAIAALVVAAGFAAAFFVSGQYGVTVTPRYVILHGLRRTVVGWADVRDVTTADFLGGRRVALHLTDGSTTRPWAPRHSWAQPDPEFDRKFRTVYEWWLDARHPDPPVPPVHPPSPMLWGAR